MRGSGCDCAAPGAALCGLARTVWLEDVLSQANADSSLISLDFTTLFDYLQARPDGMARGAALLCIFS